MEKVIKRLATTVVLILCAMFILRCCMAGDKSRFSTPDPTDALRAAYSDGESEIYTVNISREMSEDGYFGAYAFYYSREAEEIQLAVRWNNSVYEYTRMEEGHEFTFYILNETTYNRKVRIECSLLKALKQSLPFPDELIVERFKLHPTTHKVWKKGDIPFC